MLRSLPATPLVCLVVSLVMAFAAPAGAEDPDKALDVLLKPGKAASRPAPEASRAQPAVRQRTAAFAPRPLDRGPWLGPPPGITKVKPPQVVPCSFPPPCILPQPKLRQWEISAQVFWVRNRGTVAWPRNSWWWSGWQNEADLTDDIGVPKHEAVPQFNIRYQFRPNWSLRYSILTKEFRGGGTPGKQFTFGYQTTFFSFNTDLQSKWEHTYQRVGLAYDPIKTCSSSVTLFADWMHTDDKIQLSCSICGPTTSIQSIGGDSMVIGLEFQRCLATAFNGGTFSYDCKFGFIFLDNVEGWDIQLGARYSIPLGCGRSGFVKGGWRYLDINKSQTNLLFKHTMEGGFLELGFIF